MSGFKEQLKKDTDIFLNENEFSDEHTVNGKKMIVQVDDNEALERQLRANQNNGVYKRQIVLYIASQNFDNMPYIGMSFNFDGVMYRVADVSSEAGIYAITIERNKA